MIKVIHGDYLKFEKCLNCKEKLRRLLPLIRFSVEPHVRDLISQWLTNARSYFSFIQPRGRWSKAG